MSIRRGVVTALIAAVAASAGISGCSDADTDEPVDSGLPSESATSESTPPSPTTEPTPTESSGPTSPEIPAAATKYSKAGAKAFVRYYLALLNYATRTGDVDPILQNATSGCAGCKDDAKFFQQLYDRGGWAKGLDRRLKRVVAIAPAQPEDVYVGVVISRSKGTYRLRRGATIKRLEPEDSRLDFYLNRVHERWLMARVERPS